MSAADRDGRGMDYLRPFLPGLESVLEDEDVSEIMINGPGNVWVESRGEIRAHPAPILDDAALDRAAIQIARPLGLDPATAPILDARLDDGSRVAICVPPAAPHVAITIRRFGKRSFSPEDLVRFGLTAPGSARRGAGRPPGSTEYPRVGRHGIGQDHVAQCPGRAAPRRRPHCFH